MDDFDIEIVPRNNRSSNTKVVNINLNTDNPKKTSRKKPKSQQKKPKQKPQQSKKRKSSLTTQKDEYVKNDIEQNIEQNIKQNIEQDIEENIKKGSAVSKPAKKSVKRKLKENNKEKGKENEKPTVVVKVIKSDNTKQTSSSPSRPTSPIKRPQSSFKKTPEYLLNTRRVSSRKKTPPKRLSPKQHKRRLSPRTIQKLKLRKQHQSMINERIRNLKEKQKLLQRRLIDTKNSNPVEEYFKNKNKNIGNFNHNKKRLTPPRKIIHISPDYNMNTTNKPVNNKSTKNKQKLNYSHSSKKDLLIKRKMLLEARKKLLTKKKFERENRQHSKNNINFNLPIKSPLIQSLEYKKERLKNQRQKELDKISHKKKNILSLNTKKQELKLLEEIQKEELEIKKLQDKQRKLDKLHFIYKENIKKGYDKKKGSKSVTKPVKPVKPVIKLNNKHSSPKKERIYSMDGILLSSINKSTKSNNSNKKSIKNEKYKINDLSQIEEFMTEYDEVIWEDEPNLINNNSNNFNNLIINNIDELDDFLNFSKYKLDDINNGDNKDNDDIHSLEQIKIELEENNIFNNTSKLSDDLCKVVYSSINNSINLEKIN